MKNIIVTLCLLLMVSVTIQAQDSQAPKDTAEITFEKKVIELGNIKPGKIPMEYEFKNTGKGVLQITNVSPGCGCTVADYPKNPILPGEKGVIKAFFTWTSPGRVTKNITVTSNSKTPSVTLLFNANVTNETEATANSTQAPAKETKKQ